MALKLVSLALAAFMAGGISGVSAQDTQQPSEQQAPAEQAAQEKPACVISNTAWKEKGKAVSFEIELQNVCGQRLKCTVDAFVIGSRGQAKGHGTLILAAGSKGQPTRNAYAMKVKSAGGMANISHSCKSI